MGFGSEKIQMQKVKEKLEWRSKILFNWKGVQTGGTITGKCKSHFGRFNGYWIGGYWEDKYWNPNKKVIGNHCYEQNTAGKDVKDRAKKNFQNFELIL